MTGILTILGSGTSTGVPIPGCRCDVCLSDNPRNKRLRTSAHLQVGAASILIDASPDLRQQALANDLRIVNAVVYTHAHADHILGTDDLRAFNFSTGRRLPCYGSQATLEGLTRNFSYIFSPDPKWRGGALSQLDPIEINHGTAFDADGVTILPFALEHGDLDVTGLRIGSLAYATDCKRIPAESMKVLSGVETLILDGLREELHPTHLSIGEAIDLAQKIGARETYLIHMTHSIDYQAKSLELPPGIALAYDGLKLRVSL